MRHHPQTRVRAHRQIVSMAPNMHAMVGCASHQLKMPRLDAYSSAMALSDRRPKNTERLRRLQNLRGWALALGVIAGAFSLIVAGASGVENPKNWSSAFSAMAAAGFLRWAAVPLAAVAGILLIAAVFLHVAIERMRHDS